MKRKAVVVSSFTDHKGRVRQIRRLANGRLSIQNHRQRPTFLLSNAIGRIVGQRVRSLRESKGFTQRELALLAGLSGSKQRMREIEQAVNGGLKLGTVYSLAHALRVEPSALLPTLDEALAEAELTPLDFVESSGSTPVGDA